jgi:phenylacetate-CoA ligase
MVIYKGVNFYPLQVERLLLEKPGVSHEYQIVLETSGGERMTVLVEVEPGFDPATGERIRREMQDLLGLRPEFRWLKQGEIPRPQGKAVRVLDKRAG